MEFNIGDYKHCRHFLTRHRENFIKLDAYNCSLLIGELLPKAFYIRHGLKFDSKTPLLMLQKFENALQIDESQKIDENRKKIQAQAEYEARKQLKHFFSAARLQSRHLTNDNDFIEASLILWGEFIGGKPKNIISLLSAVENIPKQKRISAARDNRKKLNKRSRAVEAERAMK